MRRAWSFSAGPSRAKYGITLADAFLTGLTGLDAGDAFLTPGKEALFHGK